MGGRRSRAALIACLLAAPVMGAAAFAVLNNTSTANAHACATLYGSSEIPSKAGQLRVQHVVAPVLSTVQVRLRAHWAGAWFAPDDCGKLKVAVSDARSVEARRDIASVRGLLVRHRLTAAVDFVPVRWSEAQLVAAQARLDQALRSLLRQAKIETHTDWKANAVIVLTAETLNASEVAQVASVAHSIDSVKVQRTKQRRFVLHLQELHVR